MKYQKGERILEPLDKDMESMLIKAGWEPLEKATVSEKAIVDYEEMTKAEIKEILDEKGIEYSDRDNKATLIELLK